MNGTNEPVWCWCRDCGTWVGSQPCVLPPYWSNRKAKGLHRTGSPTHRTELVSLTEALAMIEAADALAASATVDAYQSADANAERAVLTLMALA